MNISLTSYKKSKFAVAVSGGSDSLALLHLLVDNGLQNNMTVLHFDHNLRAESADEAVQVHDICNELNVKCVIGKWLEPDLDGNLQQAARHARYAFFKQYCHENNLEFVMVGHTVDDVAETFLMRLARGSGLKGLSAMQENSHAMGVHVVRPLLHILREDLQKYLHQKNVKYISDPSNDNSKFFRIRIRKLKNLLHESGLTYKNIRESALSLRRADDALLSYTQMAFDNCVKVEGAKLLVDMSFQYYPDEIKLRLIEKVILQITGEGLAPRTSKRLRAVKAMESGENKFTLGGVKFTFKSDSYLLEIE
tara:strand:- start:132072 stop:132995 length:924 start_codon:yes stop_codon:yes gene_type:complete